MRIVAAFGTVQSSIGYQFYDADEAAIGSVTTTGITSLGDGYYSATVTAPANAASVRWTGDSGAEAREYFAYNLDVAPVAAPTSPNLCHVYGYIRKPDGSIAENVDVNFTLKSTGKTTTGAAIHNVVVTVPVGNDGYLDAQILRNDGINPSGSTYTVTVTDQRGFTNQQIVTTTLTTGLSITTETLDLSTI